MFEFQIGKRPYHLEQRRRIGRTDDSGRIPRRSHIRCRFFWRGRLRRRRNAPRHETGREDERQRERGNGKNSAVVNR